MKLSTNRLQSVFTALVLAMTSLPLAGCNAPGTLANGLNGPGANSDSASGTPNAQVPSPCKFAQLTPTVDFNSTFRGGADPETRAAFRTRDCRTVELAFDEETGQRLAIAHFKDGKPDPAFGENGVELRPFLKRWYWNGAVQFVEMADQIVMVGAAQNDSSAGFAIAAFDLSGKFKGESFSEGFGYKGVYTEPNLGTSCTRFHLKVTAARAVGDQLKVEGEFGTVCWNDKHSVSAEINTRFPDLVDLKKPVPDKCADYNYDSPGAVNDEVHQFSASADCSEIRVRYYNLDTHNEENFRIDTSGKCFKSLRFGYSCFYYENGFLARESVDRYWQTHKSYFLVVHAQGELCGVDGAQATFMVESPYSPTQPEFYKKCSYF